MRRIASDEKSRIDVLRSIWDLECWRIMPDLRRIASDEREVTYWRTRSIWDLECWRIVPDLRKIASDEKSRIDELRSIWISSVVVCQIWGLPQMRSRVIDELRSIWDLECWRVPDLRRIASDEKSLCWLTEPCCFVFQICCRPMSLAGPWLIHHYILQSPNW